MTSEEKTSSVRLREVLDYLGHYFKNPVLSIRQLPEWDWGTLIILQATFAGICGLISAILKPSFRRFLEGIIVMPISSTVVTLIFSGLFYYTFLFFFKKEVQLKRIFTLVLFANLPFFALYILTPLVPPISLLGFLITGILLIVGMVDNFYLPRKPVIKIIIGLYIFYIVLWVSSMIGLQNQEKKKKFKTIPGSMDILEKEMK